jgi:hypothetical protein
MDKVTLVGILLTFIIGVVNVIVTIKSSNKSTFINTVTNARKEYIQNLRDLVAKFAHIATKEGIDKNQLNELSYQIKLMMNPLATNTEGGYWDRCAIKMIDNIIANTTEDKETKVCEFVALMQSWLAMEWHGMMNEGKKGILRKENKDELRKKHWKEYKQYLQITEE